MDESTRDIVKPRSVTLGLLLVSAFSLLNAVGVLGAADNASRHRAREQSVAQEMARSEAITVEELTDRLGVKPFEYNGPYPDHQMDGPFVMYRVTRGVTLFAEFEPDTRRVVRKVVEGYQADEIGRTKNSVVPRAALCILIGASPAFGWAIANRSSNPRLRVALRAAALLVIIFLLFFLFPFGPQSYFPEVGLA